MSNIDISFDFSFGSQGSGNGDFQYPSGILVLNDEIFVVDRQNHRIQIFDLSGVYVRQFGTAGFGNNNFFFPLGITTDGTDLYIVDGSNNRIKVHQVDGTYLSEFGTAGSGNNNFQYPTDIVFDSDLSNLIICDKQNHRIKIHDTAGLFISEFGTQGTSDSQFNFPEGVSLINNQIVVADSGNKHVKFFNIAGIFQSKITSKIFSYPTGVDVVDEIITVIDKTGNKIMFFDIFGTFLSEYGSTGQLSDEFYFPAHAFFIDSKLYVTDSGNHRIKVLNATIDIEIPVYADEIIQLTKQLYPTGRAWWLNLKNTYYKLHEGLAYSESRAIEDNSNILNSILPDNDKFSELDAFNHETALGLFIKPNLDLELRKQAILRKMQHPGDIKARQHYLYLQGQLQAAGFEVYVHENRFPTGTPGEYEVVDPDTLQLASAQVGSTQVSDNSQVGGGSSSISYTIIGNYIDASKENINLNSIVGNSMIGRAQVSNITQVGSGANYTRDELLRATLFIGDENFPGSADIPIERRDEFRELILKIKPTQTAIFLLINYI